MMKAHANAILILTVALTVACVIVIVYANSSSFYHVVYAAYPYESETLPQEWYMPDELGIVDIKEHRSNNTCILEIAVDRETEPFPLQVEQPVFLHEGQFYRVSPLWVTFRLPESTTRLQMAIGGVMGAGWILTAVLLVKWRKRK